MKNLSLKNKSHEKRLVLLTLLFTDPKLCSTRCTVTQYMYTQYQSRLCRIKRSNEYFALHRTQWVGLGAPVTNTASINTPLNNSNLGLGISIINDKIGPTDENTISADLSYTIPASETFKLSLVKATGNLFSLDAN
jgi:hypothetical protein